MEIDEPEGTLHWRREKAAEYPDDDRNERAVTVIEAVLASQDKVSSEVSAAYSEAIERIQSNDDWGYLYTEQANEYRRSIDFRRFPDDADECYRDLTGIINEIIEYAGS